MVSLNGVSPSLNNVTFNNASQSYTVAQGSGGAVILNNGGSNATLNNTAGSHTISAPVQLSSNLSASNSTGTTTTISGVISQNGGAKSLSVSGSGVLTLSNANTYSGGTTIDGFLRAENTTGSATGSGSVTVNATGTLAGSGRVEASSGNNIVINGTLQAGFVGDSAAVNIDLVTSGAGSTTMGSGSTIKLDLWSNDIGLTSTESDSIRLFGNLTFDPGSTIILANAGGLASFADGDQWQLFDLSGGGTLGGTLPIIDSSSIDSLLSLAGLIGIFDISNGVYKLSSIPEPSRAALTLIGLMVVASRRKRSALASL